MKNIIIILIMINFICANAVYDITNSEYKQYKSNPKLMIEKFKMKFLNPKKEISESINKKLAIETKIIKPKIIQKAYIEPIKVDKVIIEPAISIKIPKKKKKESFYNIVEVKNKLKYNTLLKQDMTLLLKSIDKILSKNNNAYDADEIKLVLNQIHDKKVSPFESKIYLKQIVNLLKGVY